MRRAQLAGLAAAAAVIVAGGVAAAVTLAAGGGTPAAPATAQPAPGHSSSPAPAVAASTDGLTPAQRALVMTLGPLRVHDCAPAPAARVTEPPGPGREADVDAAVVCQTNVIAGEPGPSELVARHYRDAAAQHADLTQRSQAIGGAGNCAAGQPGTQTWGRSDQALGTFICAPGAAGTPAGTFCVFWTVTADQTGLTASSADATGLIAWWRDFTKP
jgi:hypothetical protein